MTTRNTKRKIEVYLVPDVKKDLEKIRKEKGWTMAELMRRAIDLIRAK